MKRRNRAAISIAAWLMLAGALLTPRTAASYQVPINEPPQKGDPDQPIGRASPLSNQENESTSGPIFILRFQILPGVSLDFRVRVPQFRVPTQIRERN